MMIHLAQHRARLDDLAARFRDDESGIAALEYGLISAAFGAVVVLLLLLGDQMSAFLDVVADAIIGA